MRNTRAPIVVALLMGALTLQEARAAEGDGYRELVDQGLDHYNNKRFDQAVGSFERAYLVRSEPELIYNIARAQERALRRDQAIETYERFLSLPGTTAELRTKALSAVEALKQEKRAMERSKSEPPPLEVASPPPVAAQPAPRSAPPPVSARTEVGPSRTLEWSLIIGGAGVAAVGGVFGALAFKANNDFDAASDLDSKRTLRDDVRRNALVADVLVGAGLVSAGVGVVLFLVTGNDDPAFTLAPSLSEGGANVSLSGRF